LAKTLLKLPIHLKVFRNDRNLGYGGNQIRGYRYAGALEQVDKWLGRPRPNAFAYQHIFELVRSRPEADDAASDDPTT